MAWPKLSIFSFGLMLSLTWCMTANIDSKPGETWTPWSLNWGTETSQPMVVKLSARNLGKEGTDILTVGGTN